MDWTLAPALDQLRKEINTKYPKRDKSMDGTIGDTAHQPRTSEHNPDSQGIVRAIDIDKDGINVQELLSATIGDPRVHYVIWNSKIYSRDYGWVPRDYSGRNKHTEHVHISLRNQSSEKASKQVVDAAANDVSNWLITQDTGEIMSSPIRTPSAAIAWGRTQITNPSKNYFQLCLQFSRMCYSIPAKHPSAIVAWNNAGNRKTTGTPPAGSFVFWNIGKYGHIAVSVGNGRCLSNDILRRGKIDEVPINLITAKWNAKYLGWTDNVNGVTVKLDAPAPAPAPSTTVSVAALRTAMREDPSKNGSPFGRYGAQVKVVEQALAKLGFLKASLADGHYGTSTIEAVKAFQRKHSGTSKPDGWLGPKELEKLRSLAGGTWKVSA